jgi:hypothetical protein
MKILKKLFIASILSLTFFLSQAQIINTTVPPLNGGLTDVGISFNLTANDSVNLTRIAVSFATPGIKNYFIWMKSGPISGPPNINFVNGWTPVQIGSISVTNFGPGNLEYIVLTTPLVLPPGTYGMYLGGGPYRVSNYTGGQFEYYDADSLTIITTGPNVGYSGPQPTPSNTPRSFNGAVDFYPVNQSCPKPTGILASSAGGTSYSIDWTENGTAAQWELEWGPSGFTPGSGNLVNTSSKPVILSGIVVGNTYDIYVRSVCSVGDSSLWEGPYTFNTIYCNAGPTQNIDSEITNVLLQGDVFSINNLQSCPGATGVQDLTAQHTADVSLGSSYQLNVTFGTCGDQYSGAGSVWIDWNQNKIFETGELVGNWSGYPEPQGSSTFNAFFPFTTPPNAVLGSTRMRIVHEEGGAIPMNPCDAFSWGAVEDYSIVVNASPPTCFLPTNPTTSNIGFSTADINWIENSAATQWEIEYGPLDFIPGTGTKILTSAKPHTLSGLNSGTAYDYYIRSICGPGDTSGFSLTNTFRTECLFLAPWTENFDGPNWVADNQTWDAINSIMDSCWTPNPDIVPGVYGWRVGNGPTTSHSTGPLTDYSGTGNYVFGEGSYGITGSLAYLTSPFIDISNLAQPLLRYCYHMYGQDIEDLIVQVDSNGTWLSVDTISGEQQTVLNEPWIKRSINIQPTNVIRIRFVGIKGISRQTDIAIDEVSIVETPNCLEPHSFVAQSISTDGVLLDWVEVNSATQWQVEYGPTGFTQGTGTSIITSTKPLSVTGLSAGTYYDFMVRAICAPGDTSEFTSRAFIRTNCGILKAPWNEDFDDFPWVAEDPNIGRPSTLDTCWLNTRGSNNIYKWSAVALAYNNHGLSTGPISDKSGTGNFIYADASFSGSNQYAILTSPEIDISDMNFPFLEFWYHMHGNTIGQLIVEIDQGSGWIGIDTLVGAQQNQASAPWLSKGYALQPSSTVQVRFIAESLPIHGDIALDEVSIFEKLPCLQPSNLSTSVQNASTVDLSWTASANAAAWKLEYGPVGFTPGNGTSLIVTSNPYTLSGLASGTQYWVYVSSICGSGDTSLWAGPAIFTLEYCDGGPHTLNKSEVTNVVLNGSFGFISNLQTCPGDFQVQDFTAQSAGLLTDSTYTLNVTFGTCQTTHNGAGEAWIDWNQNRIFEPGESLGTWSGLAEPIGSTVFNGQFTFTVPSGANIGATRMRVMQMEGGVNPLDPCGTFLYGSIEDYTIIVDSVTPTCLSVSGLTVGAVGPDTAVVSWTDPGSGASWIIEYGPPGFALGTGTIVNTSSNTLTLSGLSPGTSYWVHISSICGPGDTSTASGPLKFKTWCNIFSTPFYEQFTNGWLPSTCWEQATGGDPVSGPALRGSSRWVEDGFSWGSTGAVRVNISDTGSSEWMLSPGIVLSGGRHRLEFDMMILDGGYLGQPIGFDDQIQVLITTDGVTWIPLRTYDNSYISFDWHQEIDLLPYTGMVVQIAIWATDGTIDDQKDIDVYIDNFRITIDPNNDLSVTKILTNTDVCRTGQETISIELVNNGFLPQHNFDVGYSLNGTPISAESVPDTIQAGDTMIYSFATKANLTSAGLHELDAYTLLVNDTVFDNDSVNGYTIITRASAYVSVNDQISCEGDLATLIATVGLQRYIWSDAGGMLQSGTSNTFSVTALEGSNDYFVEAYQGLSAKKVGPADRTIGSAISSSLFQNGLKFNVMRPTTINSVVVYINGGGTVRVNVRDAAQSLVGSASASFPNSGTYTLPVGIALSPGNGYTIDAQGSTVTRIWKNTTGAAYPYTDNANIEITGPLNGPSQEYYFFYDWSIADSLCPGRDTATITGRSAPSVDIGPDTIQSQTAVTLDAGLGFNLYLWQDGSTNQTLVANKTQTYWVEVTGLNGCTGSDTVYFELVNSIGGSLNDIEIKLYPIPADQELTLDISGGSLRGEVAIRLFGMNGQIVLDDVIPVSSSRMVEAIDVSQLTAGTYSLQLIINGEQVQRTIILK